MARRDWVPSDDEMSKAKDVLERGYRGWVNDLAEEILFEAFAENLSEDDLRERIDERTDSGLVYIADQWTVLFASRMTQEAWDELREMDSTDTEDPVGPWAVLTYRQDVDEALWGSGLAQAVQEHGGGNGDELINWLIEEHGGQDYPLKDDSHAWIIGEVDDVEFGILVVTNDQHDHKFIGRHLDKSALHVLMDLILEQGGDPSSPAVLNFLRKAR